MGFRYVNFDGIRLEVLSDDPGRFSLMSACRMMVRFPLTRSAKGSIANLLKTALAVARSRSDTHADGTLGLSAAHPE